MYFVTMLLQMCKYDGTGAESVKTALDDLFTKHIQNQDYNSEVVSMKTDCTNVDP